MIGTRLAHYVITDHLGTGGMGEVYQATDSKLGRSVAIKLLPEAFTYEAERSARFEREARVLASLNHSNIASIFGVEESGGRKFIVMELVAGETLAERIQRGPIAVAEVKSIAKQIAEALEAAHEKGVVHRDLKPANIKISADGKVKVLDFGLARVQTEPGTMLSNAPTMVSASIPGAILGTVAYMSPEQARGDPAGRASDMWSFGCVLYEMLTGHCVFDGKTSSEVLAGVLKSEPDWNRLPAETPESIRRLLRRCLEKEESRRLRDFRDARLEIDEGPGTLEVIPGSQGGRRNKERIAWIVASVCLAALIFFLLYYRRASLSTLLSNADPYRTSILLPEGMHFPLDSSPASRFALSPDGRRLAFVVVDDANHTMLWVRQLDNMTAAQLAGTEGASFPFWSPDSKYIAYFAQDQLRKFELSTGSSFPLCDASIGATGTWNNDGVILFTPKGGDPIYRISEGGGEATPVTTLDVANGDSQHWYPFFLPDGRHFLYSAIGSRSKGATQPLAIYVGSLDPKEPGKRLIEGSYNAKYAKGHVIFASGTALMAQPFDDKRLELSGAPAPLATPLQIRGGGVTGTAGAFTVSDNGPLAYQSALNAVRSQLVWINRAGTQTGTLGDPADYGEVALSKNGKQAAVSVLDTARGTRDLWLFDVSRGQRTRFTSDPANEFEPQWSPDDSSIVFTRQKDSIDLFQKSIGGTGSEVPLLLESNIGKFSISWSRDGRFLLYVLGGAAINRSDLWALPLFGDRKPFPFLETPFVENEGQFSPDGKWVAYISNESGEYQIYVTSFPTPGAVKAVSTGPGMWPRWRGDGKEIFYLTLDGTLTAAAVNGDGSSFQVGSVQPLFKVRPHPQVSLGMYPYDVSADGQRFLVNSFVEETTTPAVTLFINWTSQLKK
jgi:serine/threonine protein kinase/Tol biopolymer transport system component